MPRVGHCARETLETKIAVEIALDGTGSGEIRTGIGFFDHMLTLLCRHSLFDLRIVAAGDLQVDDHHTVEDVGICLGRALDHALGDRAGITRYGSCTLPMDDSLATVAVDLGGRAAFEWRVPISSAKVGTFDTELAEEFFRALCGNGKLNLHAMLHYGKNSHHILEAVFKSTARALRQAAAMDDRLAGSIASTKGVLVDSDG